MSELSRTQVREFACPTCGAGAGKQCVGTRKERTSNHQERVHRAEAARFSVGADGILRNLHGEALGRLVEIVVDVYGGGLRGASPPSDSAVEPSSLVSAQGERRENAVEGQTQLDGVQGKPETPEPLPGMDEGLSLYEEWLRIFERDGSKVRFGPSRKRAAKRALSEADLATCIKALEGARAYRKVKPGSEEFTDIFGTFRGTGDLASRITFFADYAESANGGSSVNPLLANVPSAQREMVRERQRHVEAWLQNPDAPALREPGELSAKWLAETVGLHCYHDGNALRWQRTTV